MQASFTVIDLWDRGANVLATASDRSMEPSRIQAKQYAEHIHAIDCIYSIYMYGK
jgi:hypothetical protein